MTKLFWCNWCNWFRWWQHKYYSLRSEILIAQTETVCVLVSNHPAFSVMYYHLHM